MKKNLVFITVLFFSAINVFSESLGLKILQKSDLSFDVPVGFAAGDIKNYSKGAYGYEIKLGTEIADFNSGNIKMGLCSTFFYNDYFLKREEVQTLFVRGITEGIWVENALPCKFNLRNEISAGLGFTKLKAEGIKSNKIEGEYNSLAIGIDSTVSRILIDAVFVAFYANAGLKVRIYKEEDSTNAVIGIMAGITIKAGKKWR